MPTPNSHNKPLYNTCVALIHVAGTLIYRYRAFGQHNVPKHGPLIIVANHQSNLDPPLAGVATRRPYLSFIARVGLFKAPGLGTLIERVGAIPIRRGEPDLPAVKTAIERLKQGGAVVVFAEGARTPHGELQPFQRGTNLLLRRAKCPVLPVAIEGFHDAWPRGTSLPKVLGPRLMCEIGAPIPADTLLAMPPDDALRHLAREVESLRLRARQRLRRQTRGRYPQDRAADTPAPIDRWFTEGGPQPESLSDAQDAAVKPDSANKVNNQPTHAEPGPLREPEPDDQPKNP